MNEGKDFSEYPNNVEIRRWAQARRPDILIHDKGNLPKFVIVAWDRTHPDRKYDARMAHHGTAGGYNKHNCRCNGCREAVNAYGRDRWNTNAEDVAEEQADDFLAS